MPQNLFLGVKPKNHSMDELRKCQYCGESREEGPVYDHIPFTNSTKTQVKVQCGCGFSSPYFDTMDEAWEFWDQMQESAKDY